MPHRSRGPGAHVFDLRFRYLTIVLDVFMGTLACQVCQNYTWPMLSKFLGGACPHQLLEDTLEDDPVGHGHSFTRHRQHIMVHSHSKVCPCPCRMQIGQHIVRQAWVSEIPCMLFSCRCVPENLRSMLPSLFLILAPRVLTHCEYERGFREASCIQHSCELCDNFRRNNI